MLTKALQQRHGQRTCHGRRQPQRDAPRQAAAQAGQFLTRTVYLVQDPECDLDYCANVARDVKMDVALKNNFGFGGTNGSLVFKRV